MSHDQAVLALGNDVVQHFCHPGCQSGVKGLAFGRSDVYPVGHQRLIKIWIFRPDFGHRLGLEQSHVLLPQVGNDVHRLRSAFHHQLCRLMCTAQGAGITGGKGGIAQFLPCLSCLLPAQIGERQVGAAVP